MDNGAAINWDIQIDRIVLDGIQLTRYQQMQLKESLEAELSRMFAGKGMPGDTRAVRGKISATPIYLPPGKPGPVQLGKQIASSVYSSLSGE